MTCFKFGMCAMMMNEGGGGGVSGEGKQPFKCTIKKT